MKPTPHLARPYANAIFKLLDKNIESSLESSLESNLKSWTEFFQNLNFIWKDEYFLKTLKNPLISQRDILNNIIFLYIEKYKILINSEQNNFLKILAENKRLSLFPLIYELFIDYKNQCSDALNINIISAFDLKSDVQDKLQKALKNKLNADISPEYILDSNLKGGVSVKYNGNVLNGSVSEKLDRLAAAMKD